jgi:hypothetical protein
MVNANTHVAFGVIITALLSLILSLSWFEFLLALWGAFAQDFDFLLSKYAKDENHRLLFTHSIWPGVTAIGVGLLLATPWVIAAGINSLFHVFIDSIDWGVTLLGQQKLTGPKILLRGKNLTLEDIKARYPNFRCYFTIQWFRNPLMQAFEVISIVGMVISLVLLNDPLKLLALLPYAFFACLHYISLLLCIRRYKNA